MLGSSGLCCLCHPLGGFGPAVAALGFSLGSHRFPAAHLLFCRRSTRGTGFELLGQSTDVSNVGIRLFDPNLDRLIAQDGDLIQCPILERDLMCVIAFGFYTTKQVEEENAYRRYKSPVQGFCDLEVSIAILAPESEDAIRDYLDRTPR